MNSRSWFISIVILSALIVAVESIAVEGALNIILLDIFIVTAIPAIIGGIILTVINRKPTVKFVKELDRNGWIYFLILSLAGAFGAFFWFDAVGKIGAGKEALLGGGSSEVLFVVLLSAIFLSERLTKLEITGGALVLIGVFIVLVRTDYLSLSIGAGEIEAIFSSFLLASSVVMTAKLLKKYEVAPVAALQLIINGAIILLIGFAVGCSTSFDAIGWIVLISLGIFPAMGIYTYYYGLRGVGASIASILFSLNGIITLLVQIIILTIFPGTLILPQNLALALIGGSIAFIGVYLLNRKPPTIEENQSPKKVI